MLQLDRHTEALAAFETAPSLKPGLAALHLFAGIEYMRAGRTGEGVAALRKAVALDPDNTKALWELGGAYIDSESYDRAVSVLSRLVERTRTQTMLHSPWHSPT